mmetsp:Transcript_80287/g.222052  ORF Transcript_80287/g.222052 Transcript_80287/m.222052 type:complete len:256 (+) Transcript_80287:210-977(+)
MPPLLMQEPPRQVTSPPQKLDPQPPAFPLPWAPALRLHPLQGDPLLLRPPPPLERLLLQWVPSSPRPWPGCRIPPQLVRKPLPPMDLAPQPKRLPEHDFQLLPAAPLLGRPHPLRGPPLLRKPPPVEPLWPLLAPPPPPLGLPLPCHACPQLPLGPPPVLPAPLRPQLLPASRPSPQLVGRHPQALLQQLSERPRCSQCRPPCPRATPLLAEALRPVPPSQTAPPEAAPPGLGDPQAAARARRGPRLCHLRRHPL